MMWVGISIGLLHILIALCLWSEKTISVYLGFFSCVIMFFSGFYGILETIIFILWLAQLSKDQTRELFVKMMEKNPQLQNREDHKPQAPPEQ